jgi:hypothetical protein
MVIRMVEPTGYAGVRYVWISVPFIACLFDGKKYVSADNVPKPESRDLRRIRQGKVKAPRAPTLRSLVKLAVRCQSAEELGRKLRRRYQRQQ